MHSSQRKPRTPAVSRDWESWVFNCAAELFRAYAENGKSMKGKILCALIDEKEPTMEKLRNALYPVDIKRVFSIERRRDSFLSITEFSATLVESMHRLEVFDRANTGNVREPDLTATLVELREAVVHDPVLSMHRSNEGVYLKADLRRKISSSVDTSKSMTASEWLQYAAQFRLRRKVPFLRHETRPMRSPLAPPRPSKEKIDELDDVDGGDDAAGGGKVVRKRDPETFFDLILGNSGKATGGGSSSTATSCTTSGVSGNDSLLGATSPSYADFRTPLRPSSIDAKFRDDDSGVSGGKLDADLNDGGDLGDVNMTHLGFPAFAVNQILGDIKRVKIALEAERDLVFELREQIATRDKEIALLYEERDRGAKMNMALEMNLDEQKKETRRLMDSAVSSPAEKTSNEKLRGEKKRLVKTFKRMQEQLHEKDHIIAELRSNLARFEKNLEDESDRGSLSDTALKLNEAGQIAAEVLGRITRKYPGEATMMIRDETSLKSHFKSLKRYIWELNQRKRRAAKVFEAQVELLACYGGPSPTEAPSRE